ncbi:unnamed protein product [Darwinula stevensoni]|uniref:Uncharacterized protein n=1 Tax=Darwinula stevensoni TaxID=69355 RepID=A0A7R8XEI2_9CRUS|nr:unnamed protein product [Darwinula stevensoni]CAG0894053.1 unnamed protein product [Darwinula stevensoni]
MGCGSSKATEVSSTQATRHANPNSIASVEWKQIPEGVNGVRRGGGAGTGNSIAFEVPVSESIIKKHPPRRLQKLEDQQIATLNHQTIEEKQAEADRRRQRILSQRVQSAKRRSTQTARSGSRSADLDIAEGKAPPILRPIGGDGDDGGASL